MKRNLFLLTLLMALFAPWALRAQTTVTIGDPAGTGTNTYLPMYSFYNYSYTQQIYEACEIGTAGTINSVTLWLYNGGSNTLPTFDFDIYMVETTQDAFASNSDWVSVTSADIVYSGTLTVTNTTAQAYTFTLPTPFEFSGHNNLMIAFDNKTGSYKSGLTAKSFAKTGVNCSHYVYRDAAAYTPLDMSSFTGSISVNRDVIAFDMNPDPSVVMCCPVENLKAEDVEAYTARLTWESDATDFVVEYKKASEETWTPATANGNEAQLSGLTPETAYNARVMVDCGGGDYSLAKTVNFTTEPSCFVPTGFGRTNLTYQSVTLNWTSEADAWDVQYITVATDPANNDTTTITVNENPYTLTGLTAEQAYKARVRANCGSQDGVSDWTSFTSFTTLSACTTPTNLTCTALTATTATLSWVEVGNSTEWEVLYILGQDSTRVTVTENPYTITGLTTEVAYTAKVRATCGETESWSNAVTFEPTDKWVIGAATTTHTTLPANNYYNYSLSEQIYTAAELGEAAAIFSIDFYKANTVEMVKDLTIYIVNTNKTKFENATDWIPVTTADIYYQGTVTFADNAWTTITLDVPYAYDGTSNLAIVVDNNTGSYKSSTPFRCYTASDNQSLCQYSDSENLDPTAATVGTGSLTTSKNMIRLVKGEMPSCLAPNGLTCTAVTANTATLDWNPNGNETEWVIQYSTDAEFANASEATANAHPFELTGLTAETVYYARVKAGCDSDWSAACNFMPTARITIGEGTATSGYFPGYFFYNYSYTEQIYTVAELGDAAMIESIDFYCASTPTMSRTFDIYMVSTDKSAFTGTAKAADWIPVTAGDKVCTKSILLTQGWNTFELDSPFFYDGTQNVALVIRTAADDNYESSINFRVFDATAQALYVYNDNSAYDPTNPSEYSGTVSNVKNQIRILKGELPSCFVPKYLAVSEITARSAELSWTAGAEEEAWQICINGDETDLIDVTRPNYAMTELTPNTTYMVKVRANCGEGDFSDWTNELSFTTEVACPAPTNVTASDITPFSATLSWSCDASQYNVQYRPVVHGEVYESINFDDSSMGNWTTIDADGDGFDWKLASDQMTTGYGHEASNDCALSQSCYSNNGWEPLYPDNYLVSPRVTLGGIISFWACAQDADYPDEHFGVAVSTTGNTDPDDFTTIQEWTMTAKGRGVRTDYSRSGNREQGNWYKFTVDLTAYEGNGYVAFRHFDCSDNFYLLIDDVVIEEAIEPSAWIDATTTETTLALTGLDPETEYEWQVQAVCGGEDGTSDWTHAYFTTLSNCMAPYDLNIPTETIMPTTAVVEWNGYQDSYEVWYRPATIGAVLLEDDFEDGTLDNWTMVDADGDGDNWQIATPADYGIGDAYSGTYCASSWSWNGDTYYPDNYMISPLVDGAASITYYVSTNMGFPDHYAVMASSTDTDITSFTIVFEEDAYSGSKGNGTKSSMIKAGTRDMSTWAEKTVQLPAGTKYVAFRHFNSDDMNYLFIDDVTINGAAGEEQEWKQATTDGTSIVLGENEALIPETTYECKVRGINRTCDEGVTEWSELENFTTPGYCDEPIDLAVTDTTATTATLSWTGYQDAFNVRYRTAGYQTVYFEDDFDDDADASDWTEAPESLYYWTGTENFFVLLGYTGSEETVYAVSPQLSGEYEEGTFLYFAYRHVPEVTVPDSAMVFKVGYSTTTADLADFTWGEDITSAYSWTEFIEEIPAGTKYFAIQTTDAFEGVGLVLDYFGVYAPAVEPGEWVVVENETSPLDIAGLNPETWYEWQVQGVNCDGEGTNTEWSESDYFLTLEETNITQTIELAEGPNWVSFYIESETLLDDLKESLKTAMNSASGIYIKTQNNGYTQWTGRAWRGTITSFDLSQMFMIQVPAAGEITLEGSPIDPTAHPANIVAGPNWIGYPFSTEMSVANAFDGFATRGDRVKSQNNGFTQYTNNWRGTLSTLVPGQGYMYTSPTDGRTLVFPTGSSKAAKNMGMSFSHKASLPETAGFQKSSKAVKQ